MDILRAVGMLLILVAHLPDYVPVAALQARQEYFVIAGLSIFFFISAYALDLGNSGMRSGTDLLRFMRRRLLRIYPLYIPALLLFIVLFHFWGIHRHVDFQPLFGNTVVHLVGAQVAVSPRVPCMFTLWYVGAILMYYCVYVVVARFLHTPLQIVVGSLILLLAAGAIRHGFGIIDDRFFFYYPLFISGILVNRTKVFANGKFVGKGGILAAALVMATVGGLWLFSRSVADVEGAFSAARLAGWGRRALYAFLAVFCAAWLSCAWARIVPARGYRVLLFLSIVSYPVYLYHRPVLALCSYFATDVLHASQTTSSLSILLIGFPLVFLVSWRLQRLQELVTP